MSLNVGTEMATRLKAMREAAAGPAVVAAATAAGRAGETAVKMTLQLQSHEAGSNTPSAPGTPPAKISGNLARSVQRIPTVLVAAGFATTTYGPTAIYGVVQEFGMTIHSKGAWPLRNADTGQVFGQQVTLPPRPFMRPTTVRLADSGTLANVTGKAFQAALLA